MRTGVAVQPITDADLAEVGAFLHARLNARLTAAQWAAALTPTWETEEPDHGFLLRDAGHIVGVYAAFYSTRTIEGRTEPLCNLAAWCVEEAHRAEGLRLVRAMLARQGVTFTDLSPSGSVVPLNERLGFDHLDTTTVLVPNLPLVRGRRATHLTDPSAIEAALAGEELRIYRDHTGAAAARHVVLVDGDRPCYVMYRRVRRKRLPVFAALLHVGDRDVLAQAWPALARHLLREGLPFTLVETRMVATPPAGLTLRRARPKMFRSRTLRPDQIDYLYSELTCVPW